MAASLCPVYMLGKLTNYVKSSDIEHELDKILFRFLRDKIGKQQVPPLPLTPTPHPPPIATADPPSISRPTLTPSPIRRADAR